MPEMLMPQSILEYLEIEDKNAKTSARLHAKVLAEFTVVDRAIKACLVGLTVDNPAINMVAKLYHFVHYQFLSSVANLMRLHLGESMACTRKAVDATLTAYELLEHPEKLPLYLTRERHFQNIKGVIQRARKHDPTKYPLAVGLLEIHDLGSQYGSHADISSFVLRTSSEHLEGGDVKEDFCYFQVPGSQLQGDSHYVNLFHNFMLMTRIFDPFTETYANLNIEVWRTDRDRKLHAYTTVGMSLLQSIHAEQANER